MPYYKLGENDKIQLVKRLNWIINHANEINLETTTTTGRNRNERRKNLIMSRAKTALKILEEAQLKL